MKVKPNMNKLLFYVFEFYYFVIVYCTLVYSCIYNSVLFLNVVKDRFSYLIAVHFPMQFSSLHDGRRLKV